MVRLRILTRIPAHHLLTRCPISLKPKLKIMVIIQHWFFAALPQPGQNFNYFVVFDDRKSPAFLSIEA